MASPVVPSNLKCSICLELFSDPRLLPCLHTYCLKCLQGLVSDKKSDLSCPQCRAKYKIPKGGVVSYLSDLSVLPELEATKVTAEKEEVKICGLCTTGAIAVGYCSDCGEYLCESCRDVLHNTIKVFTAHSIISLECSSAVVLIGKSPLCPHHPKYELEIFCKTCDILVCSMCMLETTHKGHSYDFFKNVQDELMERIKSMTSNIEEEKKKYKSYLAFLEKFEHQFYSQQEKLAAEITAACDEYITRIQAMKEELLKQTESKFTRESKTIWSTKDCLEVMISQIESCQGFSERYQRQGSEGQMLLLFNQILHRLKELNSRLYNLSALLSITGPRTVFKKSPLKLTSLGTLLSTDEANIFTPGIVQKTTLKVGQQSKFAYILNEPLAQLVKWNCKYGRNNSLSLSSCPVIVTNDSQLEIKFAPTLPGEYRFHLMPSHFSIKGFLFTVTVDNVDVSTLIGARVKRGPDWHYGNIDGGAEGTIVNTRLQHNFTVRWDASKLSMSGFRWGSEGKFDIELVHV